jgi:3-dehydroquinate synthase
VRLLTWLALQAIKKTRDGSQRFAIPRPLGTVAFLNDVSTADLHTALQTLKTLVREHYPSLNKGQAAGAGVDAYVDAGDLGTDPEAYRAQAVQGRGKDAAMAQATILSGRMAPVEVSVKA